MKRRIHPDSPLGQKLKDDTHATNADKLRALIAAHADANAYNAYAKIEVTHRGETRTLSHWGKCLNIATQTLVARYKKGLRGEELLSTNMWGGLSTPRSPAKFPLVSVHKSPRSHKYADQLITYEGETRTLKDWAEHLGAPYNLLQSRLKAGKTGLALFTPDKHVATNLPDYAHMQVTHNDLTMNLKQWATHLSIPYATLRIRYARGKRGAELFQEIKK